MNRTAIAIPLLLAVLAATGCSGATEASDPDLTTDPSLRAAITAEPVTPDPDSPSAAGAVDWSKYEEGRQATIDELAAAGDCEGLLEQFTAALEADAETLDASGSGTSDLMGYIDDRRQEAECP